MFNDVSFADNPPNKTYLVLMLIGHVARSTQYEAYTKAGAIALAKTDNPNCSIIHVERVEKAARVLR